MSDVTICCADIPEGDKEAIIGGVIAMGGQHSSALSKMVTHLVALTLDNDKCEVAVNRGYGVRLFCPIGMHSVDHSQTALLTCYIGLTIA